MFFVIKLALANEDEHL